ncbi:hypothetical protein GCM10010363_75970 [Streptomyces omiyaensis]|nr:hypothetical protein GCM10010363_75970 [Streptomyces omiyaensis]
MRLVTSFSDAASRVSGISSKVSGRTSSRPPNLFARADGQQLLAPPPQRRLGTVREPLHERREQVVRRPCGEVRLEPGDRESLAEAVPGGLLGQVKELPGVDGSDGARES